MGVLPGEGISGDTTCLHHSYRGSEGSDGAWEGCDVSSPSVESCNLWAVGSSGDVRLDHAHGHLPLTSLPWRGW